MRKRKPDPDATSRLEHDVRLSTSITGDPWWVSQAAEMERVYTEYATLAEVLRTSGHSGLAGTGI